MSDLRRHIRNAAVTALKGETAAGDRVYPSRVWPHDELPDVSVFTRTDAIEAGAQNLSDPGPQQLALDVELRALATTALEAELDELAAAAEAALLTDAGLAALTTDLQYRGMEASLESAGPVPVGLARLAFLALYGATAAEAPSPPTFSGITSTSGPTAINIGCATDRSSVIRLRARLLLGGVPTGLYIYSAWESVPKTTGHLRQLAGLARSNTYRVWIKINAVTDPDQDWTLLTAGGVGPDFTTAADGANPIVPTE